MTEVIAEIPLTKPLETPSGEKLETLTLRPPKTGDVIKFGQPIAVEFLDGKINAKADPEKLAKYLPSMTGQPQIILEGLELADMFLVLGECEIFFTQQSVEMAAKMFSIRQGELRENLPLSEINQPNPSTP